MIAKTTCRAASVQQMRDEHTATCSRMFERPPICTIFLPVEWLSALCPSKSDVYGCNTVPGQCSCSAVAVTLLQLVQLWRVVEVSQPQNCQRNDVTAADAEKKDPEQFAIWRKDPANFSFDGRYPLLEVYDKAKEAWKGVSALFCDMLDCGN